MGPRYYDVKGQRLKLGNMRSRNLTHYVKNLRDAILSIFTAFVIQSLIPGIMDPELLVTSARSMKRNTYKEKTPGEKNRITHSHKRLETIILPPTHP